VDDTRVTAKEFRILAPARLTFLESRGFRRNPSLEEENSLYGTLVYLGKHVGFIISFDVRDQVVDSEVTRVENGQIKRSWDGGYSSSVFMHLVNYEGYRGGFTRSHDKNIHKRPEDVVRGMVDAVVDMLERAGKNLLEDHPESLP